MFFSSMTFSRAHIGVLEFITLHYSVQDKDVGVYSEHNNTKCHTFTLKVSLLTIMWPMQRSHNIIKHNNAKILV